MYRCSHCKGKHPALKIVIRLYSDYFKSSKKIHKFNFDSLVKTVKNTKTQFPPSKFCAVATYIWYFIHHGHQGIQRCQARVKTSVWWPGVSQAVEVYVKNCSHCQKRYVPPKEPLISSTLPSRPWDRVAADLFELNNNHYIVIVDYFSRYPEVCQLKSTTSVSVVKTLKARHGVPSVLFSDNGPQFNSTAFKEFSSQYHFQHVTSSPRYPQSNGLAERTVKTVKALLTRSSDPQLALLNYHATPLPWCSISPAELLFGCKIATDLPQPDGQLSPDWPYLANFRQADSAHKSKQQADFNRRHRTRPLPE